MVKLPKQFVATKYPGYFWDIEAKRLYSCKSGELKEMKVVIPNYFNHLHEKGYQVSVKGQRRVLLWSYLLKLKPGNSTFPVFKPAGEKDEN